MGILPIIPNHLMPASAALPLGSASAVESALSLNARAAGGPLSLRLSSAGDTLEAVSRRDKRRAARARLRAEAEAGRTRRKALRAEAAVNKRIRQAMRELAAFQNTSEGRMRLAYSASELYEMLQTAERLNIQV